MNVIMALVSPVQSIEFQRILNIGKNSYLNQRPLGPQSRVVTTILSLHTSVL